ncbi:SprB repeat-containing protein, partial [Enterococcus casseliflavus]
MQSSVSDVSCFGGHDGSISIDVKSGVEPFQFSWTGQA